MTDSILDFLVNGNSLSGIHLGYKLDEVFNILGQPIEKIGDKKCGYLIYENGIKYGYFGSNIDELIIDFSDNVSYQISLVLSDEISIISNKMLLHKFLQLLQRLGIPFEIVKNIDPHNLILKINKKVGAFFDLETGVLFKISICKS